MLQAHENGIQIQPVQPARRNSKGFALTSSSDGGSVLQDILFVLTCCMSVALTAAVPINVYESGLAYAVTWLVLFDFLSFAKLQKFQFPLSRY